MAERTALDDKGRCCGRKPVVYKREGRRFCTRCEKSFNLATGQQVANWAYRVDGDEAFRICVVCHKDKPCGTDHSITLRRWTP